MFRNPDIITVIHAVPLSSVPTIGDSLFGLCGEKFIIGGAGYNFKELSCAKCRERLAKYSGTIFFCKQYK